MESLYLIPIYLMCLNVMTSYAQWDFQNYLKREHSLIKPYQGSGMTIPNWNILGSCFVTNGYIRLTPNQPSNQGALWNMVPVHSPAWEIHVQFKVHGEADTLFGDGFAVWYAKDPAIPGPVFGSKDYFMGLAVIVDTYSNHNGAHKHSHPYISAMINNGSSSYDHDKDGTHTQLDGCEVRFRNYDHDTYLSIRYEKDVLTVSTDLDNKAGWKTCFSIGGVRLPTGYHLGITAATGELSDNHDIVSVKFYELDISDIPDEDRSSIIPSAAVFEPPREHVDDDKPEMLSLKKFLLILFGVIVLTLVVIIGLVLYQKQQERNRKRFY